jgi:hypothetical protein
MHAHVRSRVKLYEAGTIFDTYLGVRQGESLSCFLFAMYFNDVEKNCSSRVQNVDIESLKLFLWCMLMILFF